MKKFALISVSNKHKIVDFAKALIKFNYEIIATGNTAKTLSSAGLTVKEISSITNFPEIFDGRVKTLHPKIFGGILQRRDNEKDKKEAAQNSIDPIDVVCVNLYPFIKVAENPLSSFDEVIENIDIGGPSLVRAAAKNFEHVCIITNPNQYDTIIEELESGGIKSETRKKLAVEAFAHTSLYDTHIANFLEKKLEVSTDFFRINLPLRKKLRYGENPHQNGFVYGNFDDYFEVFHGKEISYNNILDLIAAVELVEDLGQNACSIIKHMNPAGASALNTPLESYVSALKCDPVSAFGGIVAINGRIEVDLAEKLNELFLEIVCATDFSPESLNILFKKKDRRLVKLRKSILNESVTFRNIPGGVLVQDSDRLDYDLERLKYVTESKPNIEQLKDLLFAWKVAKHTKSNAIVFAKQMSTLGVGAGQMSRLDSAKIAAQKAKEHGLDLTDSVAASDAFFPFADGLLEIIKYGATAVIQPGGSVRDDEVIQAANQNNISMVFTGIRHFKH
ncbi:MAG: bifunctional phosphoribosylaminoimidazolecarboxamide formyltransferase/IMP cyclohydrolase [Ignavibacteriaceae bacterium]|nr:bifunctional phosphoribosylaminoimidazolecarboxamide formyltransferase/IMP cyclohydrolase [Ignavibacteriaceae bacterium]